mmetsp:Transcript_7745/g.11094  ORF Transcript_7745/g.11094 Transcript_7745/m.11094 type:complete len:108 (-) Transcript_7745:190-513(-)
MVLKELYVKEENDVYGDHNEEIITVYIKNNNGDGVNTFIKYKTFEIGSCTSGTTSSPIQDISSGKNPRSLYYGQEIDTWTLEEYAFGNVNNLGRVKLTFATESICEG